MSELTEVRFKVRTMVVRAIVVVDGDRYLMYSRHDATTDEELLQKLNDEGLWGTPLSMESVTCMDIELEIKVAVEQETGHGAAVN